MIEFINDLRARLANRVQLTTDGLRAYLTAVEATAQILIMRCLLNSTPMGIQARVMSASIALANVAITRKEKMIGDPDMTRVSTSHIEG